VALVLSLAFLAGCGWRAQTPADGGAVAESADAGAGVPVTVGRIEQATLPVTVRAPGRTDALEQQKVRAPFKGFLVRLLVVDGDHVRAQQIVGLLVSQESQAALTGAEALLRSARTPQQKQDGERALELAREGLVRAELRAPKAGVVVAHGADEGSLVAEAQDIVALAVSSSFFFRADLVQTELPRIRAAQPAVIELAASAGALRGSVHGVLPTGSPTDLTSPVRIDFAQGAPERLGLFGTATITVDQHVGVLVVPMAAILRDDVSGVSRMALVTPDGRAHWVEVATGLSSGGRVEVQGPSLRAGTVVVVTGQVGLPEGARVQVTT
jgi:multidrug efflux pump subunit AcrA (membrane-fusion protein)